MNALITFLKRLISNSENIDYTNVGFEGVFTAKDPLLTELISYCEGKKVIAVNGRPSFEFIFKDIRFPEREDFELGNNYAYQLTLLIDDTVNNFFPDIDSVVKYTLTHFQPIEWRHKIVLPFEKDFHPNLALKRFVVALNKLIILLRQLTYTDVGGQLVVFTDKPLVIPITLGNGISTKVNNILEEVKINEFEKKVKELQGFFDNKDIEIHLNQKRSIFLNEVSATLINQPESERFYHFLIKIEDINNSIDVSYTAYLKNFSYQKLELELKKELDYFVKAINDTLSSLQVQAIGLPVAMALVRFSKNDVVGYVALLSFCIFVSLGMSQLYQQLRYVSASKDRFFNKENVVPFIDKDEDLKSIKEIINKRIKWTNRYVIIVIIFAYLCILYACYSVSNIFF